MSEAACDRVLLVDDDQDVCETIQTVLELYGHRVITAGDGAEALALLHGGVRPCLILLDLMMPRMNGVQFREEQIRTPSLRAIPVVVLTGDGRAEAKAAALGLQSLRKPVALEVLVETVRRFCAGVAIS